MKKRNAMNTLVVFMLHGGWLGICVSLLCAHIPQKAYYVNGIEVSSFIGILRISHLEWFFYLCLTMLISGMLLLFREWNKEKCSDKIMNQNSCSKN